MDAGRRRPGMIRLFYAANPMIPLIAFLFALLVAATGTAWLLRRAGLVSDGIVAGLLVGVMLGPTVLGRIAPAWWEDTVTGGTEARAVLDHAVSERQAYTMASTAAGLGPAARADGLRDRDARIEQASSLLAERKLDHARPWTVLTTAFSVAALWLGWCSVRSARPRPSAPSGAATTFALSCWVVLLPGFVAILLLGLLGWSPREPATLLVAIAVSVSAWPPGGRDAGELRRLGVRNLVGSTAMVGTLLLIAPAVVAHLLGSPAWSMIALPLVVLGATGMPVPESIRRRRRARRILARVILPTLAALCVVRSEVLVQTPWILAIGLILIAGDGRAIAWMIGLKFSGLPSLPGSPVAVATTNGAPPRTGVAWRTALLASGAGGPQLAFTASAAALGGLDSGMAFALALGAGGIDLFGPSRRRLAGL